MLLKLCMNRGIWLGVDQMLILRMWVLSHGAVTHTKYPCLTHNADI